MSYLGNRYFLIQCFQMLMKDEWYFLYIWFYLDVKGRLWTLRRFSLIGSVQVLPLDVTTPRGSYAWSYKANDTPHSIKMKVSLGWFQTDHRINWKESHHWAIRTFQFISRLSTDSRLVSRLFPLDLYFGNVTAIIMNAILNCERFPRAFWTDN